MKTEQAERGKREFGAVYTPEALTEWMASLAVPPQNEPWDVLEPACANGPFLAAFTRQWGTGHRLTGVEIDPLADKAFSVQDARHLHADFLLWETPERFDFIIGNPPYGIIGDASHYPIQSLAGVKEQYKSRFQTWHGKYNIYGAFIEKSVTLLKDSGQLVFVIPGTWLVLDDFCLLRKFLAERGNLDIYHIGKAFAGVAVSAVVLHFTKSQEAGRLTLFNVDKTPAHHDAHYHGDLICFHTPETDRFEQQSKVILGDLFQVKFAARSPEYKRRPYVFTEAAPGLLPVLTGRNLHAGRIDYDTNYSGLWIAPSDAPKMREFYRTPHLVVAHTKGARVVVAVDERCYAWREDFHLIPRMAVDQKEVETYLNSAPLQEYVKTLYRDLIPHLTRTQLLRLPMPTQMSATGPRPPTKPLIASLFDDVE